MAYTNPLTASFSKLLNPPRAGSAPLVSKDGPRQLSGKKDLFSDGFLATNPLVPAATARGPVKYPGNNYYSNYPGYTMRRNGQPWYLHLPNTKIDYQHLVGDPLLNSAVAACIFWLARNFPEARLRVMQRDKTNLFHEVIDHALELLWARPNPYYTSSNTAWGIVISWLIDGNVYLLKRRNKRGQVVELYYFPHYHFEPRWPEDGSEFIEYYEYVGNGVPQRVETKDLIHLRCGIDPQNTRKGISQIRSLLREIYSDNEATAFGAALLRNMGVPSYIISPGDSDTELDDEGIDGIKKNFKGSYGGDNRGEVMVSSTTVKLDKVGYSPLEMDLKMLHRLPEERIAAVLGIPAMVAGLGAGIDSMQGMNYKEAREMAYESNIIPMQREIAAQLEQQLLPDFEDDTAGFRVDYDLSKVRVLQADENSKMTFYSIGVQGGFVMVSEARAALGLTVDNKRDDMFLRPIDPNSKEANMNSAQAQMAVAETTAALAPTTTAAPGQRGGGQKPRDRQPNGADKPRRQDARARQSPNPKPTKDFDPDEPDGITDESFDEDET